VNNRVEGLIHLDVKSWHALFRSGVSMSTLESIFVQNQKNHQFVNQIHFPRGQIEMLFESDEQQNTQQKTDVWINSFVSAEHFTEVKIDADILQHSLELLTQYSENSLRESIDRGGDTAGSGADTAGAAGEDNTSQNSSPTSTAKVQHKLHVRGTILWPRGKCKFTTKSKHRMRERF